MNSTLTYNLEIEQNPDFLVWAKTTKAIELIWTGNSIVAAMYQVIIAKIKYKGLVKLEWV